MKPGIDLGFLGKGKDHELSMDKKVSLMFETLYGIRESGKLTSPGLIHAIQGVFGVQKNEKGEEVQVQLGMGMADMMQPMQNDISLNAAQMIAICRILKIDPETVALEAGNTKANLEYNNTVEAFTKKLIEEQQKINEAKQQAEPQKEQTHA